MPADAHQGLTEVGQEYLATRLHWLASDIDHASTMPASHVPGVETGVKGPEPAHVPTAIRAQARKDANSILETLWGRGTPDFRIPVDPVRIARQLGIDVLHTTLDPDIAGAIVKDPDQDPTILLNGIDSPNRKRFTCAHEIGHYVRRKSNPDNYEYVDFRGMLSAAGTNDDEIYANEFAASLLMPEREVRRLAKDKTEVELAWRFDVSREAMHFRLDNLGIALG